MNVRVMKKPKLDPYDVEPFKPYVVWSRRLTQREIGLLKRSVERDKRKK